MPSHGLQIIIQKKIHKENKFLSVSDSFCLIYSLVITIFVCLLKIHFIKEDRCSPPLSIFSGKPEVGIFSVFVCRIYKSYCIYKRTAFAILRLWIAVLRYLLSIT